MYVTFTCHFILSQNDPMAINDIKDDLREECSKMGEVKKVILFDVSRAVNFVLFFNILKSCLGS